MLHQVWKQRDVQRKRVWKTKYSVCHDNDRQMCNRHFLPRSRLVRRNGPRWFVAKEISNPSLVNSRGKPGTTHNHRCFCQIRFIMCCSGLTGCWCHLGLFSNDASQLVYCFGAVSVFTHLSVCQSLFHFRTIPGLQHNHKAFHHSITKVTTRHVHIPNKLDVRGKN